MTNPDFTAAALALFQEQYRSCAVYRSYCEALRTSPETVAALSEIPFLPISFFKTHEVISGNTGGPFDAVFKSSGTTGADTSRHFVKDLSVYETSFRAGFEAAYGPVTDRVFLALLPSYLERSGSSLVYMAEDLVKQSSHPESGFFLYEHAALAARLQVLEARGQKTLLLGVTFALLDFAEAFPMPLQHTVVMETGGMKGRKKEQTREEVQAILKNAFSCARIHSEYGMTEMLSQAYSSGEGIFKPSATMRALVREVSDPLSVSLSGTGVINIIDLSNKGSCAFLATEDVGKVYADGSFEIMGRLDHSALRGCSLLTV